MKAPAPVLSTASDTRLSANSQGRRLSVPISKRHVFAVLQRDRPSGDQTFLMIPGIEPNLQICGTAFRYADRAWAPVSGEPAGGNDILGARSSIQAATAFTGPGMAIGVAVRAANHLRSRAVARPSRRPRLLCRPG